MLKPLPRYWKAVIRRLTGMNFCDRNCGCGENSRLWWFPVGCCTCRYAVPKWLPCWMNGATTEDVWQWLVKHKKTGKEASHAH